MKIILLTLILSIFLSACTNQNINKSQDISMVEFLTEAYNSGNYGKDFYANAPVLPISNNEVMLLGIQNFVPYDENNIIAVVAEILDTPDEVAIGGYVGSCSYRHKRICMYNINSKELSDLVDIESGYAGGLKLHNDNILEYHCGSLMYTETLCLYDIANKKQYTICTYEPEELDVINTMSDKLYSRGEFYYMRFDSDESEKLQIYRYSINTKTSELINSDGIPCIYNNAVCCKVFRDDTIQFYDIQTLEHISDISSGNKLYLVYESDFNEYFNNIILNNVVKKVYQIGNGEFTEYTILDDNLTDVYQVYFHTPLGVYVYLRFFDGNSAWRYIPY